MWLPVVDNELSSIRKHFCSLSWLSQDTDWDYVRKPCRLQACWHMMASNVSASYLAENFFLCYMSEWFLLSVQGRIHSESSGFWKPVNFVPKI